MKSPIILGVMFLQFLSLLKGQVLPSFYARPSYDATSVTEVQVADFNGDGIPDIVNNASNGLCTLFGNGDGTFRNGPCTPLPKGIQSYATNLVVADFNKDGKPDVGFVYPLNGVGASRQVVVIFGQGDGTFANFLSIPIPAAVTNYNSYLNKTIAVDFDGDGNTDLAVCYLFGVMVAYGKGNGSFYPAIAVTWQQNNVGLGYSWLATGDVNGDGHPDLVATTSTGYIVLLSQEQRSFQVMPRVRTSKVTVTMALADMNGDGRLDLVSTENNAESVFVSLGKGDGTFGPANSFADSNSGGITVAADLNGDGTPDVITAPLYSTEGLSILFGAPGGVLKLGPDYVTGSFASGPVVADLRHSGHLDIVVAGNFGSISILLNDGSGKFLDGIALSPGENRQQALGDFNGDGIKDIATLIPTGLQIYFGTAKQKLPFVKGPFTPLTNLEGYLTVGDFNNDGKDDIAVSLQSPQLAVLLGNGNGTFGTPITTDLPQNLSSPGGLTVGDFNGDGYLDLITYDLVSVLLGKGTGQFQPQISLYPGPAHTQVLVTDMNLDGKPDLVLCAEDESPVVAISNGDGTFTYPPVSSYAGSEGCAVGDFNHDGIPDVAVVDLTGTGAGYMVGVGGGALGSFVPIEFPYYYEPASVIAGDFNGDGYLDLAVSLKNSNAVSFWMGSADGQFTFGDEFGVNSNPNLMVMGYFHGKAVGPDIIVSNSDNTFSLLLNTTPK